jgi:phosphoribosylformimino-5-aminoimidazole carboxamide ribotide isomerase
VSRDGMLQGPNFELLGQVLDATHIQVVISGGISKLADIEKLAAIKHKHFFGVIVGKALYEQKLDLKEAVKRFQNGSP